MIDKKRLIAFSIASCLALGSVCTVRGTTNINTQNIRPGAVSVKKGAPFKKAHKAEEDVGDANNGDEEYEDEYEPYFQTMDEAITYANEEAPIDTRLRRAIEKMPKYEKDDTWTILMYVCGGNLESVGRNSLTQETQDSIKDVVESIQTKDAEGYYTLIDDLADRMDEKGVPLPPFLESAYSDEEYDEEEGEGEGEGEGEEEYDGPGSATLDIEEVCSVKLPENIKVVIQTGGAVDWSNEAIDPNYSQRFVYDSNGFKEVEKNPPVNMGEKDTLKDFLNFGKNNYAADHTMVILWNHGGGVFGSEYDEIFAEDGLSMSEMNDAFLESFGSNEDNPPIELMGFDCCLMGGYEIANRFNGIARYMVASEELEPGTGWRYDLWLDALAKDPSMNGAQLGMEVTDAFMAGSFYEDPYEDITMSVVDVAKTMEVDKAYDNFIKKALKESMRDPYLITDITIAANDSVRFANGYGFDMYDICDFMNNVGNNLSKEKRAVINSTKKSVLYNRVSPAYKNARGLSVYYPATVNDIGTLKDALDFIDSISESDIVRTFYYYKLAGFLNPELQKYAKSIGLGKAPTINVKPVTNLAGKKLTNKGGSYQLKAGNNAIRLMQDATLLLREKVNIDGKECYKYYGEDRYVKMASSKLKSAFQNTWITIAGKPVQVINISDHDDYAFLGVPVYLDGYHEYPYQLIIEYDYHEGKIELVGYMPYFDEAGLHGVAASGIHELYEGTVIEPVMFLYDENGEYVDEQIGDEIVYTDELRVEDAPLPKGNNYQIAFRMYDLRGYAYDTAYSNYKVS